MSRVTEQNEPNERPALSRFPSPDACIAVMDALRPYSEAERSWIVEIVTANLELEERGGVGVPSRLFRLSESTSAGN